VARIEPVDPDASAKPRLSCERSGSELLDWLVAYIVRLAIFMPAWRQGAISSIDAKMHRANSVYRDGLRVYISPASCGLGFSILDF
jgi:hypothetical protein